MNTKCFINSNIYHHNNIYSKIIGARQYFSLRTFKNANIKALIYCRLCGSVAKRIKHKYSDMHACCEKSSNPVRGRLTDQT